MKKEKAKLSVNEMNNLVPLEYLFRLVKNDQICLWIFVSISMVICQKLLEKARLQTGLHTGRTCNHLQRDGKIRRSYSYNI